MPHPDAHGSFVEYLSAHVICTRHLYMGFFVSLYIIIIQSRKIRVAFTSQSSYVVIPVMLWRRGVVVITFLRNIIEQSLNI